MKTSRSDPAIYVRRGDEGKLPGLSQTYVSDMLRADTKEFQKLSKIKNQQFEMTDDDQLSCVFTGIMTNCEGNRTLVLHQQDYLEKLTLLHESASCSDVASMQMKLS